MPSLSLTMLMLLNHCVLYFVKHSLSTRQLRLSRASFECASPLEEVINQPVYTSQAAALSSDAVHPTAGTSNLVVIETPVPVEDRRDYLNFALPSFGCYEELLSRGTPISGPVQRAIVDKLFQECFKLAWYSSRELYRTAAERLVQTYPHLADKLGAKTSGLESWVLSLRNKFKNMWKKVENCPPEMAEKRAQSLHKRPRQPQGDVLNKKLCRLFLLLEFDILDKKNVVDEFSQGCQNLCDLALRNGDDIEVAKFSKAAGGKTCKCHFHLDIWRSR
ncbi:uncharacterized protein LOC142785326 isoform X3 [Rhipicephalus microplus]|uniref:uncharacterized protein LOC142785326 isoform X3 n=1 Tax=Rhipicephalus microplus TaxID=6941 RepID=UPI003F6D2097